MKYKKNLMEETCLKKSKNFKMLVNFGKISNGSCPKNQTHPARKSRHKNHSHLYKRIYMDYFLHLLKRNKKPSKGKMK